MAELPDRPKYDPLRDMQDLDEWVRHVEDELKQRMESQIRILGLDNHVEVFTKSRFDNETHVYRFELRLEVKHAKVFVSADRSSHYWSQIVFEMSHRAMYPSTVRHEEIQRKINHSVHGLKQSLIKHFIIEAPEQRWKLEQAFHKIVTALIGFDMPPSRSYILDALLEAGLPYIVEAPKEEE